MLSEKQKGLIKSGKWVTAEGRMSVTVKALKAKPSQSGRRALLERESERMVKELVKFVEECLDYEASLEREHGQRDDSQPVL